MKILFACVPADGHFNPLTGIAAHLRDRGHDVRWYTGPSLAGRVERLGIRFHPFRRAVEITGENIPELFPEHAKLRGPALIRFDGEKIFLANVPAFLADIRDIDADWTFDVLFCDGPFFGARPVRQLLHKRVLILDPGWELLADDPLTPPPFLGLPPVRGPLRRWAYRGLKAAMDRMVNSWPAGPGVATRARPRPPASRPRWARCRADHSKPPDALNAPSADLEECALTLR